MMADSGKTSALYVDRRLENGDAGGLKKNVDDDGREKRTGSLATASAHIITAVIGSGVLSLGWAIAQLGWVVGPSVLVAFSVITYFTSTLLADCYRSPGPDHGRRNYTYTDVVRSHLGGLKVTLCGLAQYTNLVGVTVGYTITASISMVAVKKSNCYHKEGHGADCSVSNYPYMMIFAGVQILLSQIPNFHKLSWLSILAAVMSFAYSSIGLALSVARIIGNHMNHHEVKTSITGVTVGVDVTGAEKVWRSFQAIGDIAFAYAYSTVLIEIQDTLRSHPPENRVMKKASLIGVTTTTVFYILCGSMGYAAFGNKAPGNFLTGFGFYEPFWLVDFANVCIAIHLVGAYQASEQSIKQLRHFEKDSLMMLSNFDQIIEIISHAQVFCQPIFNAVESKCNKKWKDSKFVTVDHEVRIPFLGAYTINMFRLVWRTAYVIVTALIAMIFPFFNDFLGLIGAVSFYPLTVFFPIEMHIAQAKIPKYSFTWIWLKILSWTCLIVSLVAAAGSIQGLASDVKTYKPFKAQ
ncbi:unnamed protein product [Cuscuta campestris]|uniref:Amino acid transporter transmembrane domain-containing protein n=1 Tax=Cuscuta campestris TaxID=132261 RepID=A0A484LGG4_9ASTE|nr:unnamed protein product [Cuscuta campestris]